MIVCFALQADTDGTSLKRAALMVESVRKHLPEAKIIQMANEDFPALAGVDEVVRRKNDGDFIRWAFQSVIDVVSRGEKVLQIATDVVVCGDVSSVFNDDFDIAACRYPARDRADGAFCGDVNFIKPSGLKFWRYVLDYYDHHPEIQDGWEGGQTAFLEMTKVGQFVVKELDYETYCWTPEKPQIIPSHVKIAHFRGNRKVFMEEVCVTKYPTVFIISDRLGAEYVDIMKDMVRRNLSDKFLFSFENTITAVQENTRIIALDPALCVVCGLDDIIRYEGSAVSSDGTVRVFITGHDNETENLEDVFPDQLVKYSAAKDDIPKNAKFVSFMDGILPHQCKGNWVEHIWKIGGGSSLELEVGGNVTDGLLESNIRYALTLPHAVLETLIPAHDSVLCIVGGGPSLADNIEDIRCKSQSGAAIWALNNSFKYLRDHGIEPNAHIMLDAREKNAVFVPENSHATLIYASTCHPEVFKKVDGRVIIWHPMISGILDILEGRKAAIIGCGNSVGLNAMGLAMAMGFRAVHLYGYDSSYRGDENHAYKQTLNDGERIIDVQVNGRKFRTAAWMALQAEEFKQTCKDLCENHGMSFTIHGDGLLPYVASLLYTAPQQVAA